eukprot:Filipodium_phascolosomae@DN8172_c0_g1_i1.p1
MPRMNELHSFGYDVICGLNSLGKHLKNTSVRTLPYFALGLHSPEALTEAEGLGWKTVLTELTALAKTTEKRLSSIVYYRRTHYAEVLEADIAYFNRRREALMPTAYRYREAQSEEYIEGDQQGLLRFNEKAIDQNIQKQRTAIKRRIDIYQQLQNLCAKKDDPDRDPLLIKCRKTALKFWESNEFTYDLLLLSTSYQMFCMRYPNAFEFLNKESNLMQRTWSPIAWKTTKQIGEMDAKDAEILEQKCKGFQGAEQEEKNKGDTSSSSSSSGSN